MYKGRLSPTATLAEAATLVVSTAEMLDALDDSDRAAVTAVMEERGLLGCRRIVPIEEGRAHGGYSGVEFATGSLGAGVVPLHYSVEIPVDATSLTIRIRNLTPAGVYDLYLRTGAPVTYIGPRTPGLSATRRSRRHGLSRLERAPTICCRDARLCTWHSAQPT